MRIIAGQHRGLALASVGKGDAGAHLRPTTDRVRESLFNVLTSGAYRDPITDLRVLDLFAGTGALGLEALSRGAKHVTFVDDGRKSQSLIRENITLCRRKADTTLLSCDATRLPNNPDVAYDLIFLDPPYGKGIGTIALDHAMKGGWIKDDALIVFEESAPQSPEGFTLLDSRKYGDTHIAILEPV
ncbi:16S rRNA (guanine(966)-N(2))-methyltransferase RsmD [Cochlodiniinecator piscidefendens]|uniref:16S rRNA (guanine(966)-N(2))-methyltransferase RsmD n=1 Tax=Cochlodiniinecator piscidefendens TaxID=2715756 RepID=UPI001407C815